VHVTKRFKAEELEMNMAPMIDVVFQLLIFFIVVSEIASQDRVEDLTLPKAEQAKEERTMPRRLIISVDRHNNIWVGGRRRKLEQVERYLEIERKWRDVKQGEDTKQPILIVADKYAKWQAVQDVMEIASKMQFWRLSFSVKLGGA
jgi:biopolymer transport protein ExbD